MRKVLSRLWWTGTQLVAHRLGNHGFISALAAELDAYLAFKEKKGFYGRSRVWYLKRFDTYCAAGARTVFDRQTVEGWVTQQLTASGRYRSWMSYIRDVGRWLQVQGHTDAYVLPDAQKIDRFFSAATQLPVQSPWRWQAVAFFTLMHSCGMRTGELRLLAPNRVDLRQGHIDGIWSTGFRSRRLPLTDDVIGVLAACEQATARQFGMSRHRFFVSAAGNQVTTATIGKVFNRIWDQAGLPRPEGGQQPWPHDFRHHFAYANVERWMTQGTDVTAMLPYLTRYMGHATIESTYYYIDTSPDFKDSYADITGQTQPVLPEVGCE